MTATRGDGMTATRGDGMTATRGDGMTATRGDTCGSQVRSRPRWPVPQRTAVLAAAIAGIASLVAACGGGSASSARSLGRSNLQIAIDYAKCMRTHGAPNWPDPNSQGQFLKTKTNSADFQAPAAAYKACLHLLPNGGQLTTAQQQIIAPLMLKFAGCMRSHGITNFPDPTVNANGVTIDPHGLDTSSPAFRAAQQGCRKYMTEAGKYMPPG
jgi:hypothetical protein